MNVSTKKTAIPVKHAPRVAVLVDTSTSWGRRIIKGISDYMRKHEAWHVFLEARGQEEKLHLPKGWECDGVIARVGTKSLAEKLEKQKIPVVNVSGIQIPGCEFPRVTSDQRIVAKMAASYLLGRGFHNFAYFGLKGLKYIAEHQHAFVEEIKDSGHSCQLYSVRPRSGAEPDWKLNLYNLGKWLKSLPKPLAVFAWNASSGREVIYACQEVGLLVPDEVAVLTNSDDDVLSEFLQTPLSGVVAGAEQIGHEAARMLDCLMHRQPLAEINAFIPPQTVVTRQSTDTIAIPDRAVVSAINFIRANAAEPIKVTAVARAAGISRRVLERRFLRTLERSPAEEIRRVHFEKAKEMLLKTDIPIPDVAESSGFGSPEYMAYVFKSEINKTPLQYRKDVRSR